MAKKKQAASWSARMLPSGSPSEAKGDEAFKVDPLGETLVNHPNVPPILNSTEGVPLSGEYSDKEYYDSPGSRPCMLCGLETPPVIKHSQGAALSLFRRGILTWSETKASVGPMSEPLKNHIRTGTHPDCARLYFGASDGLGSAGMDFIRRNVKPPEHQMDTMWDDK